MPWPVKLGVAIGSEPPLFVRICRYGTATHLSTMVVTRATHLGPYSHQLKVSLTGKKEKECAGRQFDQPVFVCKLPIATECYGI